VRKIFFVILSLLSISAFADHSGQTVATYDAVMPCAAKMSGQQANDIDIDLPAGKFLGSTPATYEQCVVPRLQSEGFKAPQISLLEWRQNYDREDVSLADFIGQIADRLVQ
jgi:hypothetical protein